MVSHLEVLEEEFVVLLHRGAVQPLRRVRALVVLSRERRFDLRLHPLQRVDLRELEERESLHYIIAVDTVPD